VTSILLVRHADAGARGSWPGDDLDRELSDRGHEEASRLAGALPAMRPEPITRVASSRAVRCVETVAPLADALGLAVTPEPLLLEGADPTAALAWLEGDRAPDVACSHGDVIGGIVTLLADRGVALPRAAWPKASTWVLGRTDGRITTARLEQPARSG
jgi:broad specificity phosphatase PhoE